MTTPSKPKPRTVWFRCRGCLHLFKSKVFVSCCPRCGSQDFKVVP